MSGMAARSDGQLIADYLKGDEESLEVLIKRYLKTIYHYTYRQFQNEDDAEDATQEIFFKAWQNIRKFDRTKSFKPWIFRIAKNSIIDMKRKKSAVPFSRFENQQGVNSFTDNLADTSLNILELLKQTDIGQSLRCAVEKLLPMQQSVILLHNNDGLSFREIAENLNESLNTVKSRYRRAIDKLRKIISESSE